MQLQRDGNRATSVSEKVAGSQLRRSFNHGMQTAYPQQQPAPCLGPRSTPRYGEWGAQRLQGAINESKKYFAVAYPLSKLVKPV